MSAFLKGVVGAAALLLSAHAAQATINYSVANVALSSMANGGGTSLGMLSGFFTTNDARTAVLSYDITAPAAGSFAGFEYTSAGSGQSLVASLPTQYIRFSSSVGDELQFFFTAGLSTSGATLLSTNSYDHEPSGGNRYATGRIVAIAAATVPEPASVALFGVGALCLGLARRRSAS